MLELFSEEDEEDGNNIQIAPELAEQFRDMYRNNEAFKPVARRFF